MYSDDRTVQRMQTIVYQILCEIDAYCNAHGIKYFLSGGTCLGAVRHHGFIPWDDDGDVMMPRDDYEKFIRGFGQLNESKFHISTLENDKNWHVPYARIWDPDSRIIHKTIYGPEIGVSVDVFPVDGVSENKNKRKRYYMKLKILDEICTEAKRKKFKAQHRFVPLRKLVGGIARLFGAHTFASMMNNLAKKTDYNTSKYVACSLPAHYGERETIEKKYMSDAVYMEFEGARFPVPSGYDKYLTNLYGSNYMQIPDAPNTGTHLEDWEIIFM